MEFFYGWLLGLLGVLPFLHVNTLLQFLQGTPALVVAFAFSHLVFALFPMIFFGVPSAAHGLSYLAAHQLSQKGEGKKAFFLAAAGLVGGALFAALLSPFFITAWPTLFSFMKPYTWLALAACVGLAWWADGRPRNAPLVFLGSGLLGSTVFSLPLKEPLFPLLSGLFGIPATLVAGEWIKTEAETRASWRLRHAFVGAVLGGFSVLLPALSPAFLASFAFFFYERSAENFLVLSSAVTSSKLFFDFLAVPVLRKARSAPAANLLENNVSFLDSLTLVFIGALALAASLIVALAARDFLSRLLNKQLPSTLFLALLAVGAFFASGWLGLFVLAWSGAWSTACLGLAPRKYLLGTLMAPAILYSLNA